MTITRLLSLTCAVALAATATSCGKAAHSAKPPAPTKADREVKVSDLDRTVADLLADVCEHGVSQYTCDECRYEVGVVKAAAELFDAGRGGRLSTVVLGPREVGGGSDLTAEVRLNGEKALKLGPRAAGVVRSILVDVGARVARGQALFEVESSELRQAKAAFVRGTAAVELAAASAERERELFAKGVCPRKDLLEAEAALKQAEADRRAALGELLAFGLGETDIALLPQASPGELSGLLAVRAPFAGTVLERSLSLGEAVQPGDGLLLLADTSDVWVLATVQEREVAAVLDAQQHGEVRAEVVVAAYPGRTFGGRVTSVGGTLDDTTRTAQLRIVVPNPGNLLRAGMFARVRLLGGQGAGSLALPEEAVLDDEGRSFVFVHVKDDFFVRRPVTTGRAAGGWVEVAGAVKPGDVVVARGAFLLKSDVLRSKMGAGCAD